MATLFFNGKFFQSPTGKDATWSDCLLADGPSIVHVGAATDEAVANATIAHRHDMQGRICLPGFVDGHMHLLNLGLSLQKCDLKPCKSLEDIRETIRAYAEKNPDVPRILCANWMHSMTGGKALASMIDDLDPRKRPIFIEAKDLHSSWLSSSALEELGVQDERDPEGGTIHRDENGRASGLLSESAAIAKVWPFLARSATMEQKFQAIGDVIRSYTAAGYTGMIEMAMDENAWQALQLYRKDREIPLRIAAHWLINPKPTEAENLAQVDRAVELSRQFNEETSPNVRMIGIKLILDGIIDGCTAALTEPYADGSDPELIWSAPELGPVVARASEAGLQCALHAIGDRAVATAVDALEQHGSAGDDGGIGERRHRIEHLEITRPSDAARLGRLGITASIHPVHADPAILGAWPSLIGDARCERAFAYTDFAEGGSTLAIGSDAPSAPIDPLRNLYTATTRRSAREPALASRVNPHFALELTAAVVAATKGAAYSCFADRWCGTLEPGKSADFVAVDMEWEVDKLLSAVPKQTWFMGKLVFER